MIARAYVVGPALCDVEQPMAGVPLFLRTLLHLQAAGIREIVLCNTPDDPKDPRVRVQVKRRTKELLPEPALVVPLGTLWHPNVGKRLAKAKLDDEVIAAGETAWIYAAGRASVESVIDAVAKGESPPASRETVSRPEFVVVPDKPRDVEWLLLRTLLKPTDGFVSRYLNREISLRVTRLLLPFPVSPNHMTVAAGIIGAAGVVAGIPGDYRHLVAGSLLVQTQSILDGCDGEIARLKHLHSSIGEWLDQVLDDFVNIGWLVVVGHAISLGDSWFCRWAWPVTVTALISHTLYQVGLYAALATKGKGRGSVTAIRWRGQGPPKAAPSTDLGKKWFAVKKLFEDAGRRDFFTFLYVPCSILGVIEIAFLWHAFIATVSGVLTTSQWLLLGGPETAD